MTLRAGKPGIADEYLRNNKALALTSKDLMTLRVRKHGIADDQLRNNKTLALTSKGFHDIACSKTWHCRRNVA